ncbi:MAG TPA: hypothetical protein VNU46_01595 [Gemmatimonadaceae bacterium]|jgi:hypothetical protein|nr:hypothetical protein [Gemmatimonadaceae bacterium]
MNALLTPSTTATRRAFRSALTAAILAVFAAGHLTAQNSNTPQGTTSDDTVGRAIQVAPHHVFFNATTKTSPFSITNPSNHPQAVDVVVEFAYTDSHHTPLADTIVIAPNMDLIEPIDTVVVNPGPKDHFVGRWLSGLPTQLTLAPHETKHLNIRLNPPASVPAGMYWARISARIHPNDNRHGNNLDVQKKYALPTKGHATPLQDTCFVVYESGSVHTGLAFGPAAKAVIDSADIGGAGHQNFSHALWVRLPVKLTGNAPFFGQMQSTYQNLTTGEITRPNTEEYSVFKDGVLHWVIETDVLAPGKYTLTFEFNNTRSDSTSTPTVPMTPAKITFPFEVKPAWAY